MKVNKVVLLRPDHISVFLRFILYVFSSSSMGQIDYVRSILTRRHRGAIYRLLLYKRGYAKKRASASRHAKG